LKNYFGNFTRLFIEKDVPLKIKYKTMTSYKFYIHRESTLTREERQSALLLGKRGEQIAAKYLEDKGYSLLEKNYRRGNLEIDLIAMDGDELVIVEVKSRSYDNFLLPEESVNHKKRLMIMRLTNEYVKSHNRNENVRFDIITIVKKDNGFDIKHIKNAYNIMSF